VIASISYTVPVQVLVDTETGEVQRVVVIDDSIDSDPATYTVDYDTLAPLSRDEARKAYELAGQAMWPSWDFGW
jgi:hypothetical protein